jgi:hypothetical protein
MSAFFLKNVSVRISVSEAVRSAYLRLLQGFHSASIQIDFLTIGFMSYRHGASLGEGRECSRFLILISVSVLLINRM